MQSRNVKEQGTPGIGGVIGVLNPPTHAWILALFFLLACLIVSVWVPEEKIFILLTLFIIGFSVMGTTWISNVHREGFLLNPLVFSFLLTFIVGFGIFNYVLFTEVSSVDYYLGTDAYRYLNKAMILASLALVSLWAGYRSGVGNWLTGKWTSLGIAKRFLRREYRPNYLLIIAFFLLSLSCRLLQVRLGVFGYSSEFDQLYQLAPYTQWLTMGSNLGFLALLVVSLTWFQGRSDRKALYFMVAFLIYETLFGFLSGMKAAVVMPLGLVSAAYYYAKGRIPWKALFAGIALLFLAYAVIEPFRVVRYVDPDFENRDIMAIASGVVGAGENYDRGLVKDVFLVQIANRMNATIMAACAVKYIDENGVPQNAPAFLQNIFLAPFHALVPRFLWPTKPLEYIGGWFNVEVLGGNENTSSAMTPVGYLYFAGGALAIGIGFFIIGIAQQWLVSSFWKCGSGSAFVYFGLFGSLGIIDSAVNGIIVSFVRNLLLLVSVQYFLFKK